MGEIDLAVGIVGAGSGGGRQESKSSDVAKAGEVGGRNDGLREGVVVERVGRHIRAGRENGGDSVEVLSNLNAVAHGRLDNRLGPHTGIGGRADVTHIDGIVGESVKTAKGDRGSGSAQQDAIAVGEVASTVFDLIAGTLDRVVPSEVDRGSSGSVVEVVGARTSDGRDDDVVDGGCGCGFARS